MCLQIHEEPNDLMMTNELNPQTWFTDLERAIYCVVRDDRTGENRIVCLERLYDPYLVDLPMDTISAPRILPKGTTFVIATPTIGGGCYG